MMIYPNSTWCDVTRRGQIVRTRDASVWVEDVAIPSPDTLMFLRADEDANGHLVIVGKAHGDGRGWLWREAGQTWVDLGGTYGNHAVETDGTRVYVQRSLTTYDVIDLMPGATSYTVTCAPTSQGFCDVTSPLGILSDPVRSAIPGIFRPQYAGAWFVGGARETTDVLAVQNGVTRLVAANVAPVEEVRAAWVDGEIVACAYVAAGVWTWRGTPTPIPVETWTPSPAGALVRDTWRFVVGASPTGWVRDGAHRMDCRREGEVAYFVKFGSAQSWEQWGRDAEGHTWHLCDHSQTGGNEARGECYQWSSALWLTDECHVGDVIDNATNAIRWYRDGAWGAWAPFPFRITVDAHETRSDGRERLTWSYRYGPALSVREVYVGDSDLGWWSWTLHENGATHHSEWPTPLHATPLVPVGTRVPWPDVRPIVTATPDPEGPDVPAVIFPPRNDTLDFLMQLDAFYRDALARPLADPHYVDMEGEAVWLQEYLRLRVNGLTHDQAVAGVKRQIDNVVHPPTVTPAIVGDLKVSG